MSTPDDTAARDGLATAVLALHTALDTWAAAVVGAADRQTGDVPAEADPELAEAEQAWYPAVDAFHVAAGRVLGIEPDEDDLDTDDDELEEDEEDEEEAVGVELYATVTGTGDGDPLLVVDGAGEQVIEALEAAGFVVPEWGVRLVPVQDLGEDEDDETDDEEGP